ncbi:MAG: hypothetical protein K2R98_17125 [Gemmataceae bacterium]|nr:hypothetical protein [Gemmataceae bacterium]
MVLKPNFPSKACPKCNAVIHARSKSHEACGWGMSGKTASAKKVGRPKAVAGGITLNDIAAVKALVARVGAEKVEQLAKVLAN